MSMTHRQVQLRDSDLHWREVEDELIVLDLRESRYLAINPAGKVLWGALREGATRDELIERLAATHEIGTEQAAADVDAFTAELDARGVLVRRDA
jgi:Coenzyme PQQ synthesis protein D (PqqD)